MSENFTDGYIYVSYAHADNAVEDMRLQTREIQKIITSLNDELSVLKNSWEGDDKDAYEEKQNAWNQAVDNMGKWLETNAATLNHIRDLYARNESQQAQAWQEVRSGR
ncbi:WXG100 family type VII secretion target [Streptomyces albus subsp. chlorinus]|uniref:WXG100 family type VII secretion target n=1 Tax=Streptomyces albus TaxID=1888 RepID=UPI00157129E3|nr:WXG100 family type VII secretion target [Streptomyces albus]NSC24348.1 WXG100 family type VII secretion target [Streptomyces albus subsp. chlorinus]